MKLTDLKNRLATLADKADGILASADALTDAQRAELDGVQAEIATVKQDIARFEAAAANEHPTHITATPASNAAPMQGFADVADFARAVHGASMPGGRVDERLIPAAVASNAGSAGFLAPAEVSSEVWGLIHNEPGLWNLLRPMPTGANSVSYVKDETTAWGSSGILAYWRSENAQMSATDLTLKEGTVKIHDLYALTTATEEVLADAPRLQNLLTVQAARAITWKLDYAALLGTGVGMPSGIKLAACTTEVAKKTSQTADTIVAENILAMVGAQLNLSDSFFLTRPEALVQLGTMSIGNQPVWIPPSGFVAAPGGVLMGRPVYLSELPEVLGDDGDIYLISPSGYKAYERQGVSFAESMHLYFDYNKMAFRWTFRAGGEPVLSAAVSPRTGSNSRSYFVEIADRT